MRQYLYLFLGISLITACNQGSSEEKIDKLNGYWEIKTAQLPDGSSKEFQFSEMIDYIQVEQREGFRKKVRPQIDGTFTTSEDEEIFTVKVENDSINIYYKTPFNSWKETLLSSKEDEISILNEQGIIYTYRKFTPYSIDYGEEK